MGFVKLDSLPSGTNVKLKGMHYGFTFLSSESDGRHKILHGEHDGKKVKVVCDGNAWGMMRVLKIIEDDKEFIL